jgi:predicted alpha/beta superfamily hydrolase
MGGLIALYRISTYNHVFRQAACLSPSLWLAPVKMMALLSRARYTSDTVIFLSYGQNEMENHKANRRVIEKAAQKLYAKGVNLTLRIVREAYHCEAAWEQEVPIFMDCLEL